jgi:hypothetical protein
MMKLIEVDGEVQRASAQRRPSFYRISELERRADGRNNIVLNKSKQISPPYNML